MIWIYTIFKREYRILTKNHDSVLIRANMVIYFYLLKVIGNTVMVVDRSFSTEAQKFFPTKNIKQMRTENSIIILIYLLHVYEQAPDIFVLSLLLAYMKYGRK